MSTVQILLGLALLAVVVWTLWPFLGIVFGERRAIQREHELAVLAAISEGCRFSTQIERATGLHAAMVYPTLARLERRGLITSDWQQDGDGLRREYALVRPGGAA